MVPRTSSTTAVACFRTARCVPTFGLSQNEEVCTVDASPSSSSSKACTISMSPLYFCSLFRSQRIALVDFLGALDDEEFFVVECSGGGGDAASLTPRCSATQIRCTRAAIWRNTPL